MLFKKHYSALLRGKKPFVKTKIIFRISLIDRINTDETSCSCRVWFLSIDLIKGSPSISLSYESDIGIIKKSNVTCTALKLIRTTDSGDFIAVIISCHNKQADTSFIILLHTQLWLKPDPVISHQPILGAFSLMPIESFHR